MSISDIEKKLYQPKEAANLPKLEKSEFDPNAVRKEQSSQISAVDLWKEKQEGLSAESKKGLKYTLLGVGIIIIIAGAIYGVYKYKQTSFNEQNAIINIAGPAETISGNFLTYNIKYENNNRAVLTNAVIRIYYPESFKPENNDNFITDSLTSGHFTLGDINGKTSGQVDFKGRIYSPKGVLANIKAELSYIPSVFNSTFIAKNQLSVNALSTPISLEIEAPQSISNGDAINYLISYKNTGAEDFKNIYLKIEYPEGFTFSKADPKNSEANNFWYLGDIAANQEGKITVSGKLEGERNQTRKINVYIGTIEEGNFISYNEEYWDTKILSSPLVITQTVNGREELIANAGTTLNFVISYKNEGDIGLNDIIVKEELDSTVLDYTTLKTSGGYYDSKEKSIIWKAPDYKQFKNLAAGESGTINFSIKIKEILPINYENDKNFLISSVSKIDSPDIPTPIAMNKIIAGKKVDIKVNSKLVLETKGFYNDKVIPNSGPVPPKVNNDTTYTIHWIAKNVSNDVSEARVESSLPTGVFYTGKISPENADFSYNERTNSIVWNLGKISAGTGIISPAQEVAFQIRVRPSISQQGRNVDVLNESVFSAKDLFTGERLTVKTNKKNNNFSEDISLLGNQTVQSE